MDSMGKNRYELLFMDDDASDPLDNAVAKSKKQVKTTSSTAGTGAGGATKPVSNKPQNNATDSATKAKKPNTQGGAAAGKENKSAAMNKNDASAKNANNNNNNNNSRSNRPTTDGSNIGNDKFNNKQGGANNNSNTIRNRRPNNNGPGGEQQQQQQQQQRERNVNFRPQNGEAREQRNNRRNLRENGFGGGNIGGGIDGSSSGGPGGANSGQPRQFRDRDQRGPPRNRNFEGGNRKREFDRQSGSDKTGVKAIDKRDGAGAHNWGSVKEAIDDVSKNEGVEATEKADESGNEQPTEPQAPVEEETKELTLDEWKAQKQQRAKPTYNLRKAGEGEDTSQWKKMHVLNNTKKAKETESEEEMEFDPAMYPQRVGRQQRVLDIQFNFNDGRRGGGGGFGGGRGGRGGRGPRPGGGGGGTGGSGAGEDGGAGRNNRNEGPRGGGGGGNRSGGKFRGDRQQFAAVPKVNDERQFPTLA